MKRLFSIVSALLIAVALGAKAQAPLVPQVQSVHGTDLMQVIPLGIPRADSQFATVNQVIGVLGIIPDRTVLGNVSGVTAMAQPLGSTLLTTLINPFTTTLSGAVPAPGSATNKFLRDDGTWQIVGAGNVSSVTIAGGTGISVSGTCTITTTGTCTINLVTPVTVPNGGTGATSFTANGIIYGNGTSPLQVTALGAAGTVLTGTGAAPAFSATPTLGANGGTGGQITLSGATSGTGIIKVNVAAGAGIIFQLPSANGSNGQFLTTDGAGVTSWATPGSSVSVTAAVSATGSAGSNIIINPTPGTGTFTIATKLALEKVNSATASNDISMVLNGGTPSSNSIGRGVSLVATAGSNGATSTDPGQVGGNIALTSGNGGNGGATNQTGAAAGSITLTSGNGGAAGGNVVAGNGGAITVATGNGADSSAAGQTAGQGGAFTFTAGAGGSSSNGNNGAFGGTFTFASGNGGSGTANNQIGGIGGFFSIRAGNGGAGNGTAAGSNGGAVTITAGNGGNGGGGGGNGGQAGDVTLTLGAAGTGGTPGRAGQLIVATLPTSDPSVTNALWSNFGVIQKSSTLVAFVARGNAVTATPGGTCTVGTVVGGNTAGKIPITGNCTAADIITLTFATTAPTGWSCALSVDVVSSSVFQSGSTTTTAVIKNTAAPVQNGQNIFFHCLGY